MGFNRLTKSVLNISGLPDRVQNQASALKALFDQSGVDIKEALNTLATELESDTSAENLGAKNANGEATNVQAELNNKVEKVEGKQLSTEDFTADEKEKLSNIEQGANNYTLPQASTTTMGGVKVDGQTIVVENGVAKAKGVDAADYTARAGVEELRETKADLTYVDEQISSINETVENAIEGIVIPNIQTSTTDLEAGTSELATGTIYFVYE